MYAFSLFFLWNFFLGTSLCNIFLLTNCHHHHVIPSARISLTLLYRLSLPAGLHSYILYRHKVRHPAFARPWEGVLRSTWLLSSSLLLQQCPTCLVRLTWIVFVMGGRWPYSCCFVECCLQDLFNIASSICV